MKKSAQLQLTRHRKREHSSHSKWLRKPILAKGLMPWLVDEASLTKRLQQRYHDFYVQPLVVQHAKPLTDECGVLLVRGCERAFVREVFLYGNDQPVVFAHSVMALRHLRSPWAGLATLGKKPLGATLFSQPNIKRTQLVFQKLARNNPLCKIAFAALKANGMEKPGGAIWARRSIFSLNRQVHKQSMRIMVTEVFLPALLDSDAMDNVRNKAIAGKKGKSA